ncbi:hypothetical protein [Stackebrandtia soli]|uniref:hypothetical protein n=1 Tax=Stackebrandtia soli TaxID=1892856 RepID=UPI0039E88610
MTPDWRAVDYVPTVWTIARDGEPIGTFTVSGIRFGAFVGTFEPLPSYEPLRPLVDMANRIDELGEDDQLAADAADALWRVLMEHVTVTGPARETLRDPILWFGLPDTDEDAIRFAEMDFPG